MSNCLGCGAPLKISMRECEFCGAEFASVESGAAILPKHLRNDDIQTCIVREEATFWSNTRLAVDSAFATWPQAIRAEVKQWEDARFFALAADVFDAFFAQAIPVRGECFVECLTLAPSVRLFFTNYRLVILSGGAFSLVPLHLIVSIKSERYDGGATMNGIGDRPVVRWSTASGERNLELRVPTHISPGVLEALQQASEWSALTPLERELLSITKRSLATHTGGAAPAFARSSTDADIQFFKKWGPSAASLGKVIAVSFGLSAWLLLMSTCAMMEYGVDGTRLLFGGVGVILMSGGVQAVLVRRRISRPARAA